MIKIVENVVLYIYLFYGSFVLLYHFKFITVEILLNASNWAYRAYISKGKNINLQFFQRFGNVWKLINNVKNQNQFSTSNEKFGLHQEFC